MAVDPQRCAGLAEQAEGVLDAGVGDEGGPLGLAPRASVAAEVVVLAALGAELQARRGFDQRVAWETGDPLDAFLFEDHRNKIIAIQRVSP